MTIQQVYQRYKIPTNLQQHMLRVGAIAQIILDSWLGKKMNIRAVFLTSLLHDMGKPVTFDMGKQSQFITDKKVLNELRGVIRELVRKYGKDEHAACKGIFSEIGLNDNAAWLIDELEWEYVDRLLGENKMEPLICIYSDMRVGPAGILQVEDRIGELISRRPDEGFERLESVAIKLQAVINKSTKVDVTKINDRMVNQMMPKLKNVSC